MSDKRSVSTDALETLGTAPLLEGAGRDAIHLAVEPVIAGETLKAGDNVGLVKGNAYKQASHVGIVDPFLKKQVKPGERFWLVVYPRQITSLRHVWTHPSFPEEPTVEQITEEQKLRAKAVVDKLIGASEQWLRDFCKNSDCPDFETLMAAIKNGGSSSAVDSYGDLYGITINRDYISVNGSDAHGSIPPEFWDHVEKYTGIKQKYRPEYFSCSC